MQKFCTCSSIKPAQRQTCCTVGRSTYCIYRQLEDCRERQGSLQFTLQNSDVLGNQFYEVLV